MTLTDDLKAIDAFQFLVRMKALKLEIAGLRKRGRTAYSIIKSEYGYRGTRKSVLLQMEDDRTRWD